MKRNKFQEIFRGVTCSIVEVGIINITLDQFFCNRSDSLRGYRLDFPPSFPTSFKI